MKFLIIGGVAAGASAAARLRRLDENAEIVLLERGKYVSYANCGLPYHLGGVIPRRESLLVASPEKFHDWYRIDVRTESEAISIDRAQKIVRVQRADGSAYDESYNRLLLATGSSPIPMRLPGSNDSRIHALWTVPDMDEIQQILASGAKRAVIVGAGFIGLETAENLRERGLKVTVVELAPQVLPTMDASMSTPIAQELVSAGISLRTGRKVTAFEHAGTALFAQLDDGEKLAADLVILSVGVRPNSELAAAAGLEVGPRGHVLVGADQRTSDPAIFAAGDVVEVFDPLTNGKTAIPLAGPASRQGRIAAENMVSGVSEALASTFADTRYPGSFGAAILKVGRLAAGSVGLTQRRLRQLEIPHKKICLHPAASASYYPGSAPLHVQLLFAEDGKILGAQIVGTKGTDKQIDVFTEAMRAGLTVFELATQEFAYAPPFLTAKAPANYAGMIASNVLKGLTKTIDAESFSAEGTSPENVQFLDMRQPEEFELGSIPGAKNLPLPELRDRLNELDPNQEYVTFCAVGLRGYLGERILRQRGFRVRNLTGGFASWKMAHPAPASLTPSASPEPRLEVPANPVSDAQTVPARELDVRGIPCPGPIVRLKKEMDALPDGAAIRLQAAATFLPDLKAWTRSNGHSIQNLFEEGDSLTALLQKKGAFSVSQTSSPTLTAAGTPAEESAAIVLFSNDLDRAMAALIIACGMASAGRKTGIFFTFWGLSVLRKNPAPPTRKSFVSRLFGWMLPKGSQKLSLSKMNFGGLGTAMMKTIMKSQNVAALPELIEQARALGVRFVACEMAMNVMGITRDELIEIDDVAGVASFVEMAKGGNTLFI